MRQTELRNVLLGVGVLVVASILVLFTDTLGLDTDIGTDYIQLMPSILVIVIGFGVTAVTSGVFGFIGLSVTGLGFMHLFNTLDSMDMLTSQMLSGLTVAEFNIYVLIICMLAGGVLSAVTYRN